MTDNNVQTVHENERKRGRPRREVLEAVKANLQVNGKPHKRSSTYNFIRMLGPGLVACDMKIVDGDFYEIRTGRPMSTKFVELGRIFPTDFWDTPQGRDWLLKNWRQMVSMTVAEFRQWVRQNNPRAKTPDTKDLADVLLDALNEYIAAHPGTTQDEVQDAVTILHMAVEVTPE